MERLHLDEIDDAEAKRMARAELTHIRNAAKPDKAKKKAAEHFDSERLSKAIRYLEERLWR